MLVLRIILLHGSGALLSLLCVCSSRECTGGDLTEERQHSPGLHEAGMAGFGLTTGMGTDEGPRGLRTSRAHAAGLGTDEGLGLITSRAHARMGGYCGRLDIGFRFQHLLLQEEVLRCTQGLTVTLV